MAKKGKNLINMIINLKLKLLKKKLKVFLIINYQRNIMYQLEH